MIGLRFLLLLQLWLVLADGRSIRKKSIPMATPPVAPQLEDMPGIPGRDFPVMRTIPETRFRCTGRIPGYYADVSAACQVFHICQEDGRHNKFLCPNGTLFNQNYFICDWWYNVDCFSSPDLYFLNELFRPQLNGLVANRDESKSSTIPRVEIQPQGVAVSQQVPVQSTRGPSSGPEESQPVQNGSRDVETLDHVKSDRKNSVELDSNVGGKGHETRDENSNKSSQSDELKVDLNDGSQRDELKEEPDSLATQPQVEDQPVNVANSLDETPIAFEEVRDEANGAGAVEDRPTDIQIQEVLVSQVPRGESPNQSEPGAVVQVFVQVGKDSATRDESEAGTNLPNAGKDEKPQDSQPEDEMAMMMIGPDEKLSQSAGGQENHPDKVSTPPVQPDETTTLTPEMQQQVKLEEPIKTPTLEPIRTEENNNIKSVSAAAISTASSSSPSLAVSAASSSQIASDGTKDTRNSLQLDLDGSGLKNWLATSKEWRLKSINGVQFDSELPLVSSRLRSLNADPRNSPLNSQSSVNLVTDLKPLVTNRAKESTRATADQVSIQSKTAASTELAAETVTATGEWQREPSDANHPGGNGAELTTPVPTQEGESVTEELDPVDVSQDSASIFTEDADQNDQVTEKSWPDRRLGLVASDPDGPSRDSISQSVTPILTVDDLHTEPIEEATATLAPDLTLDEATTWSGHSVLEWTTTTASPMSEPDLQIVHEDRDDVSADPEIEPIVALFFQFSDPQVTTSRHQVESQTRDSIDSENTVDS